jgi:hypothetical protein
MTANICQCGCGHATVTAKSRYCPGHDARHVAVLLAAFERGGLTEAQAVDLIASPALKVKLANAIRRYEIRVQMKAAGATNRAVQRMAKHVNTEALTVKDIAPVKIGRWLYPARQDKHGAIYRNLKTNGTGEWVAA